jgi:hypothetical protein
MAEPSFDGRFSTVIGSSPGPVGANAGACRRVGMPQDLRLAGDQHRSSVMSDERERRNRRGEDRRFANDFAERLRSAEAADKRRLCARSPVLTNRNGFGKQRGAPRHHPPRARRSSRQPRRAPPRVTARSGTEGTRRSAQCASASISSRIARQSAASSGVIVWVTGCSSVKLVGVRSPRERPTFEYSYDSFV